MTTLIDILEADNARLRDENAKLQDDLETSVAYGKEQKRKRLIDKEENAKLKDALQAAVDCGMVPTSTAREGGASAHSVQVKVADQIRAALEGVEE